MSVGLSVESLNPNLFDLLLSSLNTATTTTDVSCLEKKNYLPVLRPPPLRSQSPACPLVALPLLLLHQQTKQSKKERKLMQNGHQKMTRSCLVAEKAAGHMGNNGMVACHNTVFGILSAHQQRAWTVAATARTRTRHPIWNWIAPVVLVDRRQETGAMA